MKNHDKVNHFHPLSTTKVKKLIFRLKTGIFRRIAGVKCITHSLLGTKIWVIEWKIWEIRWFYPFSGRMWVIQQV